MCWIYVCGVVVVLFIMWYVQNMYLCVCVYDSILQLHGQLGQSDIFKDFKEGTIGFDPTYKFDTGTDVYDTRYKFQLFISMKFAEYF